MAAMDAGGLGALTGAFGDLARNLGDPEFRATLRTELGLVPRALRHALPWLIKARDERDISLVKIVLENAEKDPFGLALEMGDEKYTWSALEEKTSQIAHVLSTAGVKRGDVVALVGVNSPFYLATLFGINRVGATAALINHHLEGQPLSHALKTSSARVAVVERRFEDAVRSREDLRGQLDTVFLYNHGDFEERLADTPARSFSRVPVVASDDFVYIYTSGTTGLPKPCKVTHSRAVAAGAGFGHVFFGYLPGDKLYCVLPLYHSNALLLGVGGCVITRTPIALRESFSAHAFWDDVQRYNATTMLYIGELCRYLVNTPRTEAEQNNPIRIAVGNGLRADVWEAFQKRFKIPVIREFYGATEAPGLIVNLTGKVGSVGRVPFRRLSPMKLVKYDVDRDEYLRDAEGFCIECSAGEVGELLIRLDERPKSAATDFRGYTDPVATRRKILTNVFAKGDRYYRSGDLMRFDEEDYFYFVDRIGDTYRWKGENVSTAEVADVLGEAPGVNEVTVCGVHVPGMEGQAGLAAVVCESSFDPIGFWKTAQELPSYAQPRFVRVIDGMKTTATFKIQKAQLRKEGVDPSRVGGEVYVRREGGYARLTPELWEDVRAGRARL